MAVVSVDVVALTKKYFEVWNAHDVEGIQVERHATGARTRSLSLLFRSRSRLALSRTRPSCAIVAATASACRVTPPPPPPRRLCTHPRLRSRTGTLSTGRRTRTSRRASAAFGRRYGGNRCGRKHA